MDKKQEEFSKIYDEYIEQIYRFVYLKVNSKEVAQDLTSDTFLKAWQKFKNEHNTPIENPRAFLYQTARNLVIDHYRSKNRIQVVSFDESPISDPTADLEKKAFLTSDIEVIKNKLSTLKDDYQNIIIWHYLEDMPISECAKLLDKTEEATRVLLSRALKSLRDKIREA